ncbi:N-acetylmuramoyl-L-alanine amidase [Marinilactibacillus piezotolerans]|uniref:N-acetylmuramoyl-L-alanine amidase n=1 Tax=Marinilactibacillus piezotolerans TaxID=258723 RepID=UPI00211851D3|nr:N-acetylmuramoyl-L-alanine amidase [Marinilactibacillus piezotolerans]
MGISESSIHNYLPKKNIFLFLIFILLSLTVASSIVLANENRVIVKASVLNVRMGPGLSYDVMTQVNEDQRLNVLDEENQWYKVRISDDEIGWVASWLVENDEISTENQRYGKVTGTEVNIRQYAGTDSQIMGTVYENTELSILYEEQDWYQILYMGKVAWISKQFVELIDAPASQASSAETSTQSVTIGEATTNIRTGPSTENEVITTASPGQQLIYLDTEKEWYKVQLEDGRTGYVADWVSSLTNVETVNVEETTEAISRAATNLSEATIMIDAGHGGKDPGAVSETGFYEKDVALSTAKLLQKRLQDAGANVMMTRSDDTFISLNDRVYLTSKASADAFISLHYDAMEIENSMSGTTTYYYADSELNLAETINRYLKDNGPLSNNGVRYGNYYVLRNNPTPSILLELGYLNNDLDISMVNTQSYQTTVVEAIYQGLREYYSSAQ